MEDDQFCPSSWAQLYFSCPNLLDSHTRQRVAVQALLVTDLGLGKRREWWRPQISLGMENRWKKTKGSFSMMMISDVWAVWGPTLQITLLLACGDHSERSPMAWEESGGYCLCSAWLLCCFEVKQRWLLDMGGGRRMKVQRKWQMSPFVWT